MNLFGSRPWEAEGQSPKSNQRKRIGRAAIVFSVREETEFLSQPTICPPLIRRKFSLSSWPNFHFHRFPFPLRPADVSASVAAAPNRCFLIGQTPVTVFSLFFFPLSAVCLVDRSDDKWPRFRCFLQRLVHSLSPKRKFLAHLVQVHG